MKPLSPIAPAAGQSLCHVPRRGRITPAQRRALHQHTPAYMLDIAMLQDIQQHFSRPGPLTLDIGSGSGDSTLALARRFPEENHIAVDLYAPGMGKLLRQAAQHNFGNLRTAMMSAQMLLGALAAHSVHRILICFPDPWPKRTHRKRRLMQPEFLDLLASRLSLQGRIYLCTDVRDYAEEILQRIRVHPRLLNLGDRNGLIPRPHWRPQTRYEQAAAGATIWEILIGANLMNTTVTA